MSQRLRHSKSYIALGFVLTATGAIGVACGSDDDPSTAEGQLTGTAGTSSGRGMAGASGATAGGAGGSTGSEPVGTAGAGTAGTEGQTVDVPIDQTPGQAGSGGNMNPVPPGAGLAPNCAAPEGGVPGLALELVAGEIEEPIYVTGVPGDDSRLMILQKNGAVRVLVDGLLQEEPFLDISGQVTNANERGALGLAFHPDYATNGLFYLHYSSNATDGLPPVGDTVVAEFQVDSGNRNLANATSRRIVLIIDQPNANHNGGQLAFGVDGMLYLGFGDGGLSNDTGMGHAAIGNAQTLSTLLGKILRIDPTGRTVNNAYGIPPRNLAEVTGQQALPEIWSYGMRNPWRFSFDACNGDLYIGDVGQNQIEEVDYVAAAADTRTIPAGLNFGWRIMEGDQCGPVAAECTEQTRAGLVLPVDTYDHDVGQSVTGGYVYRGSRVPGLRGQYVYADYQTSRFFRFRIENGQVADRTEITGQIVAPGGGAVEEIASFGTDNGGEVYIAAFNPGAVYRIVQAP
jgi:glucose/arabinose dehydrogenase